MSRTVWNWGESGERSLVRKLSLGTRQTIVGLGMKLALTVHEEHRSSLTQLKQPSAMFSTDVYDIGRTPPPSLSAIGQVYIHE